MECGRTQVLVERFQGQSVLFCSFFENKFKIKRKRKDPSQSSKTNHFHHRFLLLQSFLPLKKKNLK